MKNSQSSCQLVPCFFGYKISLFIIKRVYQIYLCIYIVKGNMFVLMGLTLDYTPLMTLASVNERRTRLNVSKRVQTCLIVYSNFIIVRLNETIL